MQFSEVIRARHSVRVFKNTPVPTETLKAIVADAQCAPSWVNCQEWKVWIATGQTLETLRKAHSERDRAGVKAYAHLEPNHRDRFSQIARDNMAVFTQSRIDAGLAAIKDESQAYLFHAPAVAFLTIPKPLQSYVLFDLGGFEQTLMLSAADHGVDSVTAFNLVKYPDLLTSIVGIPESEQIVIGIALGYAEEHPINAFRSTRRPVEDILTIKD